MLSIKKQHKIIKYKTQTHLNGKLILRIKPIFKQFIKGKNKFILFSIVSLYLIYILLFRLDNYNSSINLVNHHTSSNHNIFSNSLVVPFIKNICDIFNINSVLFSGTSFGFIFIVLLFFSVDFLIATKFKKSIFRYLTVLIISLIILLTIIFTNFIYAWEFILTFTAFIFIYDKIRTNSFQSINLIFVSLTFLLLFFINPMSLFIWFMFILSMIIIKMLTGYKYIKRHDVYTFSFFLIIPSIIIFFQQSIEYKSFNWILVIWVMVIFWWIISSWFLFSKNIFFNRISLFIKKFKFLSVFVFIILFSLFSFSLNNFNFSKFNTIWNFYSQTSFLPIISGNRIEIIIFNTTLILVVIFMLLVIQFSKTILLSKLNAFILFSIYNPLSLLIFYLLISKISGVYNDVFFITIPFVITIIIMIEWMVLKIEKIKSYAKRWKNIVIKIIQKQIKISN